MSEEKELDQTAVSESEVVTPDVAAEEPKMVPLAALEAERRKRQESEAKASVYERMITAKEQNEDEEPEDDTVLVEKRTLKEQQALTKRQILEEVYQDVHPEAVQKINKYLKPILEKKPWLAASVDSAQNRYARAYEIVQDYLHLVEEKPIARTATNDGKRIVENAQKPRSPVEIGKSAQPSGADYLKSVQGKKEFREYRQRLLRGEA